ncbi:MAG: hypothetical protein LBM22_02300 [Endomicrobium sp.]|jgi:hypothetical protein|nr:hypothetical protein [Endomicrobium sp.]
MLRYSLNNINISHNDLLRKLGYIKQTTDLTNNILKSINDVRCLAKKLIVPQCSLACERLLLNKNASITTDNGYNIKSYDVSKLLKDCFKIYGIVVTIGIHLENKVHYFINRSDLFHAVVLDAAGSVAVENVITSLNDQIKQYESNHNNLITKRYSPGYGDWLLNKNQSLLDWLGASKIGIHINNSFQMKPEKSISAILGVAKSKEDISNKGLN